MPFYGQPLLDSAQIKGMEQHAFTSGHTTPIALMERAGKAVAEVIVRRWPVPKSVWVLCGPGNNGGDGYVVARLLHHLGWRVEVYAYEPPRTPEAHHMHELWANIGPIGGYHDPDPLGSPPDLIVDALFGIGRMRRFPESAQNEYLHLACEWLAIDMPTGLDADTGTSRTPHFGADITVTFHAAKPGQYLGRGPEMCGELLVIDLGLPLPEPKIRLAAPNLHILKKSRGHKYDHGHALVLSGPAGRTGAARLAARSALRVGAGLVTIVAPPEAIPEHAARLDAIMLRSDVPDDKRIAAICLGPAMGIPEAASALPRILAMNRPTVIDADAITALGAQPRLHPACVLTPHDGEFARMFPDLGALPKPDAVLEAARRAGCTVLLKGRDTTIAHPDGRAVIANASHGREAPWLATAGSGDALAGLITGLLARGADPFQAAQTAAWLHIECARSFGPGLIAEDIAEELPKVFRSLGL